MPVRIRLSLHGCCNRPFYHLVVASSKFKRDGRHLEQVGCYDPMPNNKGEIVVGLNTERIKYWLAVGAQPTISVYRLLGMSGLLPVHPRLYLEASRARAKSATAAAVSSQQESQNVDETNTDNEQQHTDSQES